MYINTNIIKGIYRIGLSKQLFNQESLAFKRLSSIIDERKDEKTISINYLIILLESFKSSICASEIGEILGASFRPFDLGVLGYYLYTSRSITRGLKRIPQYELLISDIIQNEVYFEDKRLVWETSLGGIKGLLSPKQFHIFSVFEISYRHAIVCKILQKRIKPQKIESTVSINNSRHNLFLNYSTKSIRNKNKLIYKLEDLQGEISSFNDILNKELEIIMQSSMEKKGIYSSLVCIYIKNNLENIEFSINDVAAYLCLSERNLQRKLKTEGTSYKELLAKARKELAFFYMEKGILVKDISPKLGYKEANSFVRAFKKWHGCRIGDYKKELMLANS